METHHTVIGENPSDGDQQQQQDRQPSADLLPFARGYQIEALEKALKGNSIVYLETGSGKTLIAIMLLRSFAYQLRKPSSYIAVFLVPQVVLVRQQAEALKMSTDLKVGMYWGDMGVDFWNAHTWKKELEKYEVLVMTPAILVNCLSHSFFKLEAIKVLILDECHHACGNHAYACILRDFYHPKLQVESAHLPRILGMTASLVKSKGLNSRSAYWKRISDLEDLMDSKVYTCQSESVLAEFISFSRLRIVTYADNQVMFQPLKSALESLLRKHRRSLENSDFKKSTVCSLTEKLSKMNSNFLFCLTELGVWLGLKAAESLSCHETDIFFWKKMDASGQSIVKSFSEDAFKLFLTHIPAGWSICDNWKSNTEGLLTTKVICLVESIMEYRSFKDLRCIIFVERVITAIVLHILLREIVLRLTGWRTEYIAGNNSGLQSQTRKQHNTILEEFRRGSVNIIVATSILEEGLDVQSCNLVIRFDPSTNVCSFIQSRGRARMQNSEFLIILRGGDLHSSSQLKDFLASGNIMREESLRHATDPCAPIESSLLDLEYYRVESTGAIATLSSSISLVYFYCSRLPSDGYFKPYPRFDINKEMETCTLYLPKSAPISKVYAEGSMKIIKQRVCLEACKMLHRIGALTDNLVPEIVQEELAGKQLENEPYLDEKVQYFPLELVNSCSESATNYSCYLIEMGQKFDYDIPIQNIFLLVREKLEVEVGNVDFDLEASRGSVTVCIRYVGDITLSPQHVLHCRRFQSMVFKVLFKHELSSLNEINLTNDKVIDYYLLPSTEDKPYEIDWRCITSVTVSCGNFHDHANCYPPKGCTHFVQTKNGSFCRCMLKKSIVCTPHNGHMYCVDGFCYDLDSSSLLHLSNGEAITYKHYFNKRHGIDLCFEHEPLLRSRHIFNVQNHFQRCRQHKEKEPVSRTVELPPELCWLIMSPISLCTIYSFSYLPSVMHRIESLLIAVNLKRMYLDHSIQDVVIPTFKVLEAITTKRCQEKFHLETLEALGDSFLKFAASQNIFKTFQNQHEGLLSLKREKIISNAALCQLGCDSKLPGFIRNEPFDPNNWIIPGEESSSYSLHEEMISATRIIYVRGKQKLKKKTIADVVEALIGAFLSCGGEKAAVLFMSRLGIKVDFSRVPYKRDLSIQPEKLLNIEKLQLLLNYTFSDPSLLLEALTHGSYMLPEIPRCYQRLEYLGDAVLDYLVTLHLYGKDPEMSPGLLTDLRSASVNNDCYARAAVKAGLQLHILHYSPELHKQINSFVEEFKKLSCESTFGWESVISVPKVLGDIIESLAGAIYIDSEYNKDVVFQSLRPLLEPLVTPATLKIHPVRELQELCQKQNYDLKKHVISSVDGVPMITVEVLANGVSHKHTCSAAEKKIAKKVASKEVLKSLKESMPQN